VKLIIAGPRDLWVPPRVIDHAVLTVGLIPGEIELILHGDALGIDMCAWLYAEERRIPHRRYPARWDEAEKLYGKRNFAGPIRNEKMARAGDELLAIQRPGKETTGTSDMKSQMDVLDKKVHVYRVEVRYA
jgi:hypothetical protein